MAAPSSSAALLVAVEDLSTLSRQITGQDVEGAHDRTTQMASKRNGRRRGVGGRGIGGL
jgi:hypothetical protein